MYIRTIFGGAGTTYETTRVAGLTSARKPLNPRQGHEEEEKGGDEDGITLQRFTFQGRSMKVCEVNWNTYLLHNLRHCSERSTKRRWRQASKVSMLCMEHQLVLT
jgi:hypothetical protein